MYNYANKQALINSVLEMLLAVGIRQLKISQFFINLAASQLKYGKFMESLNHEFLYRTLFEKD